VTNMNHKVSRRGFQHFLGLPVAYEVSVGAVIVRRTAEGFECLLLKYRHGHWDLVKGHSEAGETHEETLRREAKEEVDIDRLSVMPGFRKKTRYFYVAKGSEREKRLRDKRGLWIFKKVYWYLAETTDTQVFIPESSHEHTAYAWLPLTQAVERATFPAIKRILKDAQAFLAKQEANR
jgi:8-oxo-dGTP pyrophosphatase MutT (NUDIX family)